MADEKKKIDPEKRVGQKIQIQVDEETAQGDYVNLFMVNHSASEFVLDGIYVQPQRGPQHGRAKVRSRLIVSPQQVKRLSHVLQENLKRYEERFGVITLTKTPPPESQVLQ